MKHILIFSLLLQAFLFGNAQGTVGFGEEVEYCNSYFAFKIMPALTGDLIQCAIITRPSVHTNGIANYEKVKETVRFITPEQFAKEFTGYSKSEANPKSENLALKHHIFEIPDTIKYMGDAEIEKFTVARMQSILNNAWRLRYRVYPYETKTEQSREEGWARNSDPKINYLPSQEQFKILESYGIINGFNDFVKDEKAVQLLHDLRDRNFQTKYMQAKDANYVEPKVENAPTTTSILNGGTAPK